LNSIPKDERSRHIKDLWPTKQEEEASISTITDENVDAIMVEELTEATKYSKNKKAPGYRVLLL
jgi:hypothetical protein